MIRMHQPPHPGEVLKKYIGKSAITVTAYRLGVNRTTLPRILSGDAGVSIEMAYRLGDAFGTNSELWAGMQLQYDLYRVGRGKQR